MLNVPYRSRVHGYAQMLCSRLKCASLGAKKLIGMTYGSRSKTKPLAGLNVCFQRRTFNPVVKESQFHQPAPCQRPKTGRIPFVPTTSLHLLATTQEHSPHPNHLLVLVSNMAPLRQRPHPALAPRPGIFWPTWTTQTTYRTLHRRPRLLSRL